MESMLVFRSPGPEIEVTSILSFSDAAFNISAKQQYGQTGLVTGIHYEGPRDHSYHLIDWSSTKQRRVSHSSYGAEILACTDADDRGYSLKLAMKSIFPEKHFKHILNVDSKGLYDTVTTLHEGKEYLLRQTVQRIRDSFESGDVDTIRWIQSNANIADALTKRSPNAQKLLNRIARESNLVLPDHQSCEVHAEHWK